MIQLALMEMGIPPAVAWWLAIAIGVGIATAVIVACKSASERSMDICDMSDIDLTGYVAPLTDEEIVRLRELLAEQKEKSICQSE